MIIKRWTHGHWHLHVLAILQMFAKLLDALVTLASIGFLMSGFELRISRFRAKHSFTLAKKFRDGN